METKTGKRIVSKSAYVKVQSLRVSALLSAYFLLLVGLVCALFVLGFVWWLLFTLHNCLTRPAENVMVEGSLAIGVLGLLSTLCAAGAWHSVRVFQYIKKQTQGSNNVLPFTRANTADLPAPDSLVRASSEPEQAQQAVLLRAAAEGVETLPEQLVRASAGKQE